MKKYFLFCVVCLTGLIASCSLAHAYTGVVKSVHDGDTITVITDLGATEVVRIYRIDAPEIKYGAVPTQPYALESRDALVKLCPVGSPIIVARTGSVSYGRSVATLTCGGVAVIPYMIKNGYAWVYRYTSTKYYKKMQLTAQTSKVGLWSAPAVEPYLWRRGFR